MESVQWKVEGMTCTNCVLTISKFLEKEGLSEVKVNMIGGEVSFDLNEKSTKEKIIKGIEGLGYRVLTGDEKAVSQKAVLPVNLQRFLFCLVFTIPLMLHMFVHIHILMNPWVQLALCMPVYIMGMWYFGRSALQSIRNGIPNMNVLITLGATAAFIYSLTGSLLNLGINYLFYETTATIVTLIFLGNWLEERSVQTTQRSLEALAVKQKVMANIIAFDEHHQELVFPLENTQLKTGDLLLIKSGEQVPIDCKILWGDASVNESIITGESMPVEKKMKDILIGGSILENGTVKAQVTAVGNDTVLSQILRMVQQAQGEKPPVQLLADKISAIFVPVVIGVAVLTFMVNYMAINHPLSVSLMRSIAVLVIACPCAMGLATPAAIAVGLGRGARSGILFRNARSLEVFKDIRQVVFDKTGTLTTGQFAIAASGHYEISKEAFERIVFSLEKYSTHPIAKSLAGIFKQKNDIRFTTIEEVKGKGVFATDKEGNQYAIGSAAIAPGITDNSTHDIYVMMNNRLIGWFDITDAIRPEAAAVIASLHAKGIHTILLSGDKEENCHKVARQLGIKEVIARQSPEQKLTAISRINALAPTAMVGDGINDAPALAKATVGISMSDATQIAMQSAQVVLMKNGIANLPTALGLGKHTYSTIRQNLFWAFCYNIIAIPIAAIGLLTPGFAALIMGLSDVVLAVNSVRLNFKKLI
jgi:P-type Cu+ transporter